MSDTKEEDTQDTGIKEQEEKSFISKKYTEVMKRITKEETIIRGKQYVKDNVTETIAGVLLILGFILSIWFPECGGSLVAFISGLVFSKAIAKLIGKCFLLYQSGLVFKPFVLVVLSITVLITHPYPMICLAIAVALRWVVQPKRHPLFEKNEKEEI